MERSRALDDAKQIRDIVDVLYEQGKDAHYILDAIDSYAVNAGLVSAPNQGAVEVLEWYADARNYVEGEWSDKSQRIVAHIDLDGGERARSALGGR